MHICAIHCSIHCFVTLTSLTLLETHGIATMNYSGNSCVQATHSDDVPVGQSHRTTLLWLWTSWLRVVALLWHDVTVGWYIIHCGRPAFGLRPIFLFWHVPVRRVIEVYSVQCSSEKGSSCAGSASAAYLHPMLILRFAAVQESSSMSGIAHCMSTGHLWGAALWFSRKSSDVSFMCLAITPVPQSGDLGSLKARSQDCRSDF